MANETEKTILPYLNVLEVETIDKSNVTKVIVIDKDDEVKVMDGSQLATNSYFDLQDKPEINGIELNGNMTSEELGLASSEDIVTINSELEQIKSTIPSAENIDNQITERLADYPTKEEVTTEISDAVANKADKSEIPTKTSQLINDSGFISSLDGYATEKWVEDNYLTKEAAESALNSKQNKLNQGDGIVIEENTISADYNTIRNKPSLNGTELSGAASIVPTINIQSVPSKVTLAPVFGNQTGEAVELPIYNTETNQAGIVNGPLYAQLADKYTKAEIDALNTAINKEIASKQGTLTAGKNISIIDNVISAFENHFLLNLDENDPVRQKHIYDFIRTNLDFYLFCQITYKGDIIVIPVATIEHPETIDLYGYYFQDNGVLVVINAILVNNGNMTVKVTEVDLTNKGYTKEEVDAKLEEKQGVFAPQAPLAFNGDKTQLSVDLSTYATNDKVNALETSLEGKIDLKQDKGDYALKSELPTKVSELENDSQFVTEAEVSGDLANKADKQYVDEQLALKADSTTVESLSEEVATNSTDISTLKSTVAENGEKIDSLDKEMATKQDTLVSGTNIKTINNESLLGEGNITIDAEIPYLFVGVNRIVAGDFDAVYKSIQEDKPCNIYLYRPLQSYNVTAEMFQIWGDNIQASFHTEASGIHTLYYVTISSTSVTTQQIQFDYQEKLVSGTNIKTINDQDILGEGNIVIDGGSSIPYLVINDKTHLSGDFNAVFNAISNKTPYNLYYVSILGYNDLCTPEVVFASGSNIQATFHFESGTTNHTLVTAKITPTGVSVDKSYHNYQEQLVSGTNIKTVNGESLLGSGNIDIESVSNSVTYGSGTQPQVHTILVVTQSEYDAISSKDPNTQYLIVE